MPDCLIWPDLIRDYDDLPSTSLISLGNKGLIWPDLIRDYDNSRSLRSFLPPFGRLIWPDLIRDYDTDVVEVHWGIRAVESLIWPDLIRDYDNSRGLQPRERETSLIWPDLIRDYDERPSWIFARISSLFDMTWLDKGLRRGSVILMRVKVLLFDMTWLDKGLRRTASYPLARWVDPCLIWPDLIRDYDYLLHDFGLFVQDLWFDMTWLDKGLRHVRPHFR